jgi:hypothetical protein
VYIRGVESVDIDDALLSRHFVFAQKLKVLSF